MSPPVTDIVLIDISYDKFVLRWLKRYFYSPGGQIIFGIVALLFIAPVPKLVSFPILGILILYIWVTYKESIFYLYRATIEGEFLCLCYYHFNQKMEMKFDLNSLKTKQFKSGKGPVFSHRLVINDKNNRFIQFLVENWSAKTLDQFEKEIKNFLQQRISSKT